MTLHPRMVCAVCGRVLNHVDGSGWVHPIDPDLADHPPVAVPDTEIEAVEKCDFCYSDNVTWVIPARPFVVLMPRSGMGGDWAACDECCRMVEKNRWNALMRSVRESWETRHGPMPDEVEYLIRGMFRQLRKHITGPARPK